MVYTVISIIILLFGLLSNYYMDNIELYQKKSIQLDKNPQLVQCVQDTYLKYYTDIHLNNLKYVIKSPNELKKRFDNTFVKFFPNKTEIYRKYIDSNGNSQIFKDDLLNVYSNPTILDFFDNLRSCNNKNYILYFKDVDYYSNGIVDLPKINIEVFKNNKNNKYDDFINGLNSNNDINKMISLGKININDSLNQKFNDLKNIVDEISVIISQYSLKNTSNKDLNMFAVKNGVGFASINSENSINTGNTNIDKKLFNQDDIYSTDPNKVILKLNGGQSKFIQSNGLVFIDSYNNYCFNPSNDFNSTNHCYSTPSNPIIVNNSFHNGFNSKICEELNPQFNDTDIFFPNNVNALTDININPNSFSEFKNKTSSIGVTHNFTFCYNKENETSKVVDYLEKITNINDNNDTFITSSQDILGELYSPLDYIEKFSLIDFTQNFQVKYDIKNWTSSEEKKVFQYQNTINGATLSIEKNKDFLENNLNIQLSDYSNPFFPNQNFDFFINNSGPDLMYKILKQKLFKTKIVKSGSFIEFAVPTVPDITTSDLQTIMANNGNDLDNYKILHQYKFLLTKLIEGLIIY